MTGFVKHWADLLQGLGIVLLVTGTLLGFAAQVRDPNRRGDGLTWRVRFMVRYRRQPRLRGGMVACGLVGLICYIVSWFV
jgi:hypothetical protein